MENKAVAFIRSNKWFKSILVEHGTHNGYVAVPPTNKYHGISYFDMEDIEVHGGITFSEPVTNNDKTFMGGSKYKPEYVGKRSPVLDDVEFITDNTEVGDNWWIFRFDTFHHGDNESRWNKQAVIQETKHLMELLCNEITPNQ